MVVVEDIDAFQFRYGDNIAVAGEWSGGLSNNLELILLYASETVVHDFRNDDAWHPTTDGLGASLEIIDLTANRSDWEVATAWRPSFQMNGSPGKVRRVPGDVNGDGKFDSSDLVQVFQAGEYEDQIVGNSTFEDGDWNGGGDFTTQDLVHAFQFGHYVTTAIAEALRFHLEEQEQFNHGVQSNIKNDR